MGPSSKSRMACLRMALVVLHSQAAVDGKKGVGLGDLDHLKSANGTH